MLATLAIVFLVWLPLATTLEAVIAATGPRPFGQLWKRVLYWILAAPALAANWLTALIARHQHLVDRLDRLGSWFKGS